LISGGNIMNCAFSGRLWRAFRLITSSAVVLTAVIAGAASQATAGGTASAATRSTAAHRDGLGGIPVDVLGCTAFLGAHALGSSFTGTTASGGEYKVEACGPRPNYSKAPRLLSIVFPYHDSIARYRGYQCVELSARYLHAAFGANTPAGVMNGSEVVNSYARRYPKLFVKYHNGAVNHAPVAGDVLSFSKTKHFNDLGHTGVVLSSKVDSKGNGTLKDLEENYGGSGGSHGHHVYKIKNWRVVWKQKPHIEWLHPSGSAQG
jgi:hypothetical protein